MYANIHPAIELHPGLTPATRRVYACLASHARDKGRCWPSRRRVALQAGCCLRTVDRALAQLVSLGLVRRLRIIQNHRQTSNIYILTDLEPIERILTPAPRQAPRQYVPGTPKLSTAQNVSPGSTPLLNPPQVPPHTPPTRRETSPRRASLPQDRRSTRQSDRNPRPQTQAEAALWCMATDKGYTDRPGNRRRLRLVADRYGLDCLRRLVALACQVRVHEPGAYLQALLTRQLRA